MSASSSPACSIVAVKEEPEESPENKGTTTTSSCSSAAAAASTSRETTDEKKSAKKEELEEVEKPVFSEAVDQIQSETSPLEDVFCQYVASSLIEECQPHPADVVESSSLAGVRLPDPTYSVREAFPHKVFKEAALSSLQIEGIHYAGQRHEWLLPSGERAGFFIADAAGVGKGRQVAGTILDNYVRGRKKHIWLSSSPDLFLDARRDLQDIGGYIKLHDGFKNLSKHKSGILFTTYAGISYGMERIKALVDWCGGKDFDGCLIFDECHKAKNYLQTANGTSSKTARDVVELQDRLPLARVVYCSATGVSNIKHMAFMKRLGLWGKGCLFKDMEEMSRASKKRGLGFAEMLAMEMKSRGMYVSRGLSFKNTEFSILEHQCTDEQVAVYDRSVTLWEETMRAMKNAFLELQLEPQGRTVATLQYWMVHQKFFRQMCLSMKVPCVVSEAKEAVEAGHSVVIGLQSTGEASTSYAMNQGKTGFVSSCKEGFCRFITHQFPVRSADNEDENKWCLDARQELLKLVDTDEILKKLPVCALDSLIDELGGKEKVAEMTGRRGRMMRGKDGVVSFESRGTASNGVDSVNNTERDLFMSGKKRVGIISDAASTGISLHADVMSSGAKHRRVHMTLELPWSAEKTVQQLGRSHRSFQASAPIYKLITTDLAGEMRFASAISSRLQQLGALSRGDRRAGSGMDIEALNFDTPYGRKGLKDIYHCVNDNKLLPGILNMLKVENPTLTAHSVLEYLKDALVRMDLAFESKENKRVMVTDEGDVKKFLNRLLGIPVFLQNLTFRCFWECLRLKIEEAKRDGKYDSGVVNIQGKISPAGNPRPVLTGHSEGDGPLTKLVRLNVDRGMSWEAAVELYRKFSERDRGGFFMSAQPVFGRFVCALAALKPDDRRFYRIYRPNTGFSARADLRDEFLRKYNPIPMEEAEEWWKGEYARSEWECSHGPTCQNAPDCFFGRRVYEISLLVGAGIIPKLDAMERVREAQMENERSRYERLSSLTIVRVEVEGSGPLCGVRFPARWIPFLEKELKLRNKSGASGQVEVMEQRREETKDVIAELREKAFKKPPNLLDFFPVISKEEYLRGLARECVHEVVDLSEEDTEADLDTTEPELARLAEPTTPASQTPASESRRTLRPRLRPRNYTATDDTGSSTSSASLEEGTSTDEDGGEERKRKRGKASKKDTKGAKRPRKAGSNGDVEVVEETYRSPLDNHGVRETLAKNRRQTNLTEFFKK